MGLWDLFIDTIEDVKDAVLDTASGAADVLSDSCDVVIEGIESVGRSIEQLGSSIDNVVTSGIDNLGTICETIDENKTEIITASATIATGFLFTPAILTTATSNLAKSFTDNVIRDRVTPEIGSILYCDLLAVEHSGIYIGDNKIAHLDGSGRIQWVYPDEFMERLNGFNTAISIYVSSRDGLAVGSEEVATRAKQYIGKERDYNLIFDNCHQFVSGCLTGDFENADNFLLLLKSTAQKTIGADEWRVWER